MRGAGLHRLHYFHLGDNLDRPRAPTSVSPPQEKLAEVTQRRNVQLPGRLIGVQHALILEVITLIAAAAVVAYVIFGPG
jgi:hypothetical protein